MGVELSSWVETIRRHPLIFKYEGLDGFHASVVDAAKADSGFVERQWEAECQYHADCLDAAILAPPEERDVDEIQQYLQFLDPYLTVGVLAAFREEFGDIAFSNLSECLQDPEHLRSILDLEDFITNVERYAEDRRAQYAGGLADAFFHDGDLDLDEEHLLTVHSPEEVFSHAYEEGVPLEDVLFICPGCRREPISRTYLEHNNGNFYCGLCGCEYHPGNPEHHDLRKTESLSEFSDTLSVDIYPFIAQVFVGEADEAEPPLEVFCLASLRAKIGEDLHLSYRAGSPEFRPGLYPAEVLGYLCTAYVSDDNEVVLGLADNEIENREMRLRLFGDSQ